MATATANKKIRLEKVSLTLDETEAMILKALLGHTAGYAPYGIYSALSDAGVEGAFDRYRIETSTLGTIKVVDKETGEW